MDQNLSSDLMAIDIREALFHLGEITGEITTDDLSPGKPTLIKYGSLGNLN